MINNCLVSIYILNNEYVLLAEDIRAEVYPASNEILALNPNVPVGQGFTITLDGDSISELPPLAKIIITTAQNDSVNEGDTFVIQDNFTKTRVMGRIIYTGLGVLTK